MYDILSRTKFFVNLLRSAAATLCCSRNCCARRCGCCRHGCRIPLVPSLGMDGSQVLVGWLAARYGIIPQWL